MDFELSAALRRWLPATLLAAGLLASVAFLAPAPGRADVGVEAVSRPAGAPGDAVKLTIGCGFCFPPCDGPLGDRDGVCMPGSEAPPASFPVSLVPIERAPKPHRCGPKALCSPGASGPPSRHPFAFLGQATPPTDGDSTEPPEGNRVPRYLLHFDIPDLKPGVYTYVIYCETCLRGKRGSLIAYPAARPWRLRIRPSDPVATID